MSAAMFSVKQFSY